MIEKIKELIKVEDFLKEEGLNNIKNTSYGKLVENFCNNATAFMYINLLDNFEEVDLLNFELHNGYFVKGDKKKQHSWLFSVQDELVFDLTLQQFGKKYDKFYIGKKPENLITEERINCANFVNVSMFFNKL